MSKVTISNFYCLCCFRKMPLARRKSNMREKEHLKKIYCFGCNREVNHYEVREFDADFTLDNLKARVRSGEFDMLKTEEKKESIQWN